MIVGDIVKKLFCSHKNNEVVCWHWTHGWLDNDPSFLEIQLKCKKCGKYHFLHIRDPREYDWFTTKYADKKWSNTCKPVL